MKTSIYIVTAFFVLMALLLSKTIAGADIGKRYDLDDACFHGWEPTGHVKVTSTTFEVECISNGGDLEIRVWSRL